MEEVMPEITCKECGSGRIRSLDIGLPITDKKPGSFGTTIGKVLNVDALLREECGAVRLHLKPAPATQ
jgi:hypothetical protein